MAPVPFLGTQSLPGQLESNLSPGLCPPAKIFGANKVPFDLRDRVSWELVGIGSWVDSDTCLLSASYTPPCSGVKGTCRQRGEGLFHWF